MKFSKNKYKIYFKKEMKNKPSVFQITLSAHGWPPFSFATCSMTTVILLVSHNTQRGTSNTHFHSSWSSCNMVLETWYVLIDSFLSILQKWKLRHWAFISDHIPFQMTTPGLECRLPNLYNLVFASYLWLYQLCFNSVLPGNPHHAACRRPCWLLGMTRDKS